MKKLTLILLLVPSFVWGDKLILGGVSKHFFEGESECGFNEEHPALGLERESLELGVYKNSAENTSFFVAFIKRPWKYKKLSFGYRLGIASGYDEKNICKEGEEPVRVKKTITTTQGKEIEMYALETPKPKFDSYYNYNGLLPQVQFITSYQAGNVTIDLGIAPITTLNFKLNL